MYTIRPIQRLYQRKDNRIRDLSIAEELNRIDSTIANSPEQKSEATYLLHQASEDQPSVGDTAARRQTSARRAEK